jgi:phage-related holin
MSFWEPLLLKLEVVTTKVCAAEAENIGSLDVFVGIVAKLVYLNKVSLVQLIS